MQPVHVTWRLVADPSGKALRAEYEVENRGDQTIHLLDQMIIPETKGVVVAPDKAIVRRGPDDETISIVVAHTRPRPGQAIAFEAVPVSRPVEPGETASGVKRIPLPLAAWHPYMTVEPLVKTPAKAVLDVTWLPAEPPDGHPAWEDHPTPDGKTVRTPSGVFVRLSLQTTRATGVEAIPKP